MRKRTIWKRIRWKRIGIFILAVCVIGAGTAGIYHEASKAREAMHPQIKYTMIAKKGSTLWDLCKNIDCEYSESVEYTAERIKADLKKIRRLAMIISKNIE